MKYALMILMTLFIMPALAVADQAPGVWDACTSVMPGMSWMMMPMMIMPLLLILVLVLAIAALVKYLKK
jgi:hypothetical protein